MIDDEKLRIRERQKRRSKDYRLAQKAAGKKPVTCYLHYVTREKLKLLASVRGWPQKLPDVVERAVHILLELPYGDASPNLSPSMKPPRAKPTPATSRPKPQISTVVLKAQPFEDLIKIIQHLVRFCANEAKRLHYYKYKSIEPGAKPERKPRRKQVPASAHQTAMDEVVLKVKDGGSVQDLEKKYRVTLENYVEVLEDDLSKTQSELANFGAKPKHFVHED